MKTPAALFCAVAAAASIATVSFAREKSDLARTTPVPADQPIPASDFFRLPLIRNPELNPSGTHFAAIVTGDEDKTALMIYNLETKKLDTISGSGDRDIYRYDWLTDTRLVFHLAREKLYASALLAVNIDKPNAPYALMQLNFVQLVGIPESNRERPLYWMRSDVSRGEESEDQVVEMLSSVDMGGLLKVGGVHWEDLDEVRRRNERHIGKRYPELKGGIVSGYLADKDGNLEFGFTTRDGIRTMHRLVDEKWQPCPLDFEEIRLAGTGEMPGEIVVQGPRREDKPRLLQFMDATTGVPGEVLLDEDGYNFNGWFYRHPVTHQILGLRYHRHAPRFVWFSEVYQAIQKAIEGFFPSKVVTIIGSNRAESRFFVSVYSDREPTSYYWVDLKERIVGLVKSTRPWIDPERMQPMKIIKFKTAEGRALDAYLTLPAGASKTNPAPLVVYPHGGPWARDTWGFDPEVQFLVSRGYAVLQPNYRGSTGYEWMFPEEDNWAFRKMHDDVTAATRMALSSSRIDPKRVAIMGASFGGYLTLSGLVHEPDLYRCGVAIAGVYDWERVIRDEKYDQFDNPEYGRLLLKLGDPRKEKEKFDAISPIRHIDNIRAPMFIAHGKEDSVVSVGESKRLISELKRLKIPHEAMIKGGEGHGMYYLENDVELHTRIEAFLARHLAPVN